MASKKIIVKIAKKRRGSLPRAVIRKAVQSVYSASKFARKSSAALAET